MADNEDLNAKINLFGHYKANVLFIYPQESKNKKQNKTIIAFPNDCLIVIVIKIKNNMPYWKTYLDAGIALVAYIFIFQLTTL